jgi:16S rRNA (cytosine967-C5)-methyltransferase
MTVLDLCAAPGGKTAQLVQAGAKVTAVEREPGRAERLRENLARLDLEAEIVVADAMDYAPATPFDAVLLDAPCSATGTIRRHPDILWSKTEADVQRLAGLQSRLLDAAARLVRPGGTLVHAVCSLEPEEGPAVVEAFLGRHPGFARQPVTEAEIGFAPTPAGDLRTHPALLADKGGMDGFFIARFIKSR